MHRWRPSRVNAIWGVIPQNESHSEAYWPVLYDSLEYQKSEEEANNAAFPVKEGLSVQGGAVWPR